MRSLAFGLLAVVALAPAPVSAASASHRWCMIIQDQDDGWACAFDTFEQCRLEARSGNTGFCAANPAYQPPVQPARSHKRRHTR